MRSIWSAHRHARYRHVHFNLYDVAHRADRRPGIPALAAQADQFTGSRAGSHDECIALRFIPTLIEETDKIISAQKARGADFETGNLIHRAKALVPILVPLFVSAFRRADELATAMECRCYRGGSGRTV